MELKSQEIGKMESCKINVKRKLFNRIKELPEHIKQFSGLAILVVVVISSFFVLNICLEKVMN